MDILWIDVETTGLDRHRHGIIQLAGFVERDSELVESFDLQMNPEAEFDPASQPIHGISPEEIETFPSRNETFDRFTALLRKYVDPDRPETRLYPGGYNVRFDLGFLESWFRSVKEPGIGRFLHRERIDPSTMMKSFQEYLGRDQMPSWSLRSVATKLGLSFGERHDALEDIRMTREIHRRLLAFFPQ